MEVIIIDSISHEWEGSGGILDIHAGMAGNSFTNWGKLTPRHNAFIQTILQTNKHIIGTIRSKQDYVLNEKNGKQVPEKVGLKGELAGGQRLDEPGGGGAGAQAHGHAGFDKGRGGLAGGAFLIVCAHGFDIGEG